MNNCDNDDEDMALRRATRGYWRSWSARMHNRREPDILMSGVKSVELWTGSWEYEVSLRATDGTELRNTRYYKLNNEWGGQ